MGLETVELGTLDELYAFVETATTRTALLLDHDALYRPWAQLVSSACGELRWLYPSKPLPAIVRQHLENFAHASLNEVTLVLLEEGRVVRAIDVDSVNGRSQPHVLPGIVQSAFKRKAQGPGVGRGFSPDPFLVLGVAATDSDQAIAKRYKQLVLEYHPDRVAHLGQELRDLAAKKTTEINAAYSLIRHRRKP